MNTKAQHSKSWKILTLSSIGGALEMYDFAIFANFAVILGQVFFPFKDKWISLLAAFTVFAIGYLIRPIGGIILGHLGDRVGRKKVFLLSISLMALATLCIAMLPSYKQWGVIASLLFLGLRLCQGLAFGGEIPGALTYLCEHFPRRAIFASGVFFGVSFFGMVLATLVFVWFSDIMGLMAWRLAFLLGAVIAIIGFFWRRHLSETPAFHNKTETSKVPLVTLLKHYKLSILKGFLMVGFMATSISLMYLFMHAYLKMLHYPSGLIHDFCIIGLATFALFSIIWGVLLNHVHIQLAFVASIIASIVTGIILIVSLLHYSNIFMAYLIFACVNASYVGQATAKLSALFPTHIRFSGVAIAFNIAFALGAGLSPIFVILLIHITHQLWTILLIFIATALLSLLSMIKQNF